MEYTKIKEINRYISKSINPAKMPNTVFEMYSVPAYETGHPEYLYGREIASSKVVVKKNDILLCKINPRINRVWLVLDESDNQNIASSEWIVIRTDEYNPEFLVWYFRTPQFKQKMMSEVTGIGGSLTRAQPKRVAEYLIPVIDRKRQDRIAIVLNKIASIVDLRKKELKAYDELIKSRFVEMFGNPVSNEMCWEQISLSACIESIDNGKSFVCDSEAREGEWPAVLKLSAATYGYYLPEENKAVLDKNQFIEGAAVREGDLLFTRKNTPELVGMCAYVYDTPSKLMLPDLIFRLNTNKRCNKIFLWKLINHDLFRDYIQTIATGSAKSMSNISKERLLGLKIILPPIKLQEQFAAFVAQTDKSKLTIQKSLEELETLNKALMQKYFGGNGV